MGRESYYTSSIDPSRRRAARTCWKASLGPMSVSHLKQHLIAQTRAAFFWRKASGPWRSARLVGGQGAYRLANPAGVRFGHRPGHLAARIDLCGRKAFAPGRRGDRHRGATPLLQAIAELTSEALQGLARLRPRVPLRGAPLPRSQYTFKHGLTYQVAYGASSRPPAALHARIVGHRTSIEASHRASGAPGPPRGSRRDLGQGRDVSLPGRRQAFARSRIWRRPLRKRWRPGALPDAGPRAVVDRLDAKLHLPLGDVDSISTT